MHDALQELGPGITSLTIIPDGILGYIPFEVFRGGNEKKNKYLGEEFTIRYAYSATYLKEQNAKEKTLQQSISLLALYHLMLYNEN